MKLSLQKSIILLLLIFLFSTSIYTQVSMILSSSDEKILKNAELDNLLPSKQNEIAVIGEVVSPQIITKDKSTKISEAIAKAGGLLKTADTNINIIKKAPDYGYLFTVFISLTLIKNGEQKDLNLEDGDIVVVKKKESPIKLKDFPLPIKIPIKSV